MKIVVTGATGFIGRALVQKLLADGHYVTALTRDVARAARRLPVRCVCTAWDAHAPEPAALRAADVVVHLAGEGVTDARWTADRKRAIRASRVETTRALVDAIASLPAHERPRAFVSASAIGYYGARGDEELDERSAAGDGFLAEVCTAWEGEAFKARALDLRTVAVRTGVVLGAYGGALRQMLPLFRVGVGGRIGPGTQWMSWIHLDDLVALLAWAVERPEVTGPVNGVAPAPVTNAAFTAALGHALGVPAFLPVPAAALRLALGEMSTVLLASQRVHPRAAEQLGFAFRYPRLEAALANLCNDLSEELISEQWLPRRPEEVFGFFSDARNLEKITPGFVHFRVLSTTTPELGAGTCMNYRLSLHGVPMRWQSRIETWEPHHRFVDVQTRGPYKLWQHTHHFEPFNGGTIMRDHVRYVVPFGAIGSLVAGRLVARDIEAIFDFRRAKIHELFGRG